jgi:hypothetical protein
VITLEQYFRNPTTGEARPHTTDHEAAADDLLTRRNALRQEWMDETGETCPIDQDTGCEISGSKGGTGDGGFRLSNATTWGARQLAQGGARASTTSTPRTRSIAG